jgi:hypothetical protein
MKSFNQFLKEEEARQGSLLTRGGKPQDFRNPKKTPFTATDPTPTPASRRLPAAQSAKPSTSSPGQLEIPEPKSTKVSGSKVRGAAADPWKQFPKKPQKQLGLPKTGTSSQLPGRTLAPAGGTTPRVALPGSTTKGGTLATKSSTKPTVTPEIKPVTVRDITSKPKALPAAGQTSATKSSGIKPTAAPKGKFPSGLGRNLGRAAYGLEAGLEAMDQKARGRKTGSALAIGATKAAGGWSGAKAGAATGAKLGSVLGPKGTAVGSAIGGIGGYLAGSGIAGKASETIAGATSKEKAAMATANRQRQAGTALKGIGGKTTFDTKKNTMTTGSGAQRKTVGLAKTGVVQRGGQSTAGYLAYKGGKAVYKAGPSAQSLAKTSSNPLERVGRSLFAGAYKKSDAAAASKKLSQARQSDAKRQKALGVKMKPAG